MASDTVSDISVASTKRPVSRKHRINSHSQSRGKPHADEFRLNRTTTGINRPSSKLPNVSAKASIYSSVPEPILHKPSQPQQKDPLVRPLSKLERQSTTVNPETRLPVLYTLTSDHDKQWMSEFRRKQIYALNHLMRDLEQEQFRQFCETQKTNTDNPENAPSENKESLI